MFWTSLLWKTKRYTPNSISYRVYLFDFQFTKRDQLLPVSFGLLRRLDSNERPPGYEPGELPTAPLRDLSTSALLPNCDAKLRFSYRIAKGFTIFFARICEIKGFCCLERVTRCPIRYIGQRVKGKGTMVWNEIINILLLLRQGVLLCRAGHRGRRPLRRGKPQRPCGD